MTKNIIVLSEKVQRRWKEELNQYGICYLYAMSGFGKTVQAIEFANREYKEWKRIECSNQMLEEVEEYMKQKHSTRGKILLILDNLQWLLKEEERKDFLEFLLWMQKNQKNIHCMILSRSKLPAYLMVLKLTKQLVVEDAEALRIDEEMAERIIKTSGLVEKRPDLFKEENFIKNYAFDVCVKVSQGYPIALNAYIERLKEPNIDYQTAYNLALEDLYVYFEMHVYRIWDLPHREVMMRLSVCEFFNQELAVELLGDAAAELVEDMNQVGSFLNIDAEGTQRIHPIFLGFLRWKLAELPEKERSSLYERAGNYYAKRRNLTQALECYKQAGSHEQMLHILCQLSENGDGCDFARICHQYIEELPEEYEKRFPKLLAAKAMIYSYHMEIEKSNEYLEKLKENAKEEVSKIGREALTYYVRTLIALPHSRAEQTIENLSSFSNIVKENQIKIKNILPTGNMPSIINGGIDFLSCFKNGNMNVSLMRKEIEDMIGKEAIGIADVAIGEDLYEINQKSKGIAYLTRGLSEANLRGSIRVQYTATSVMARIFQSDGQWDTAYEILKNVLERAKELSYMELIPNVHASLVEASLLKGNKRSYEAWLETNPADEHRDFYITERFRLSVKLKVYLIQGRNLEALFIVEILKKYAEMYNRTYLQIELKIWSAIIYNRIGDVWQQELLEAIQMAKSYGYIRILADKGSALLPLWTELMEDKETKEQISSKYAASVQREMKKMATFYPKYLEVSKPFAAVTKKEIQVLRMMAEGLNNQQIAKKLGISISTVKFHIGNILKKFDTDNRTSAVRIANHEGLL